MERKYWEFWGDLEERYLTLKKLLYVLSAILAIMAYVLLKVVLKPQPVIVVPGAAEVGMFLPGKTPERVIVDFGRNFVSTLGNYTPATAEGAFAQIRHYMSPRLLSRFDAEVQGRLKDIKENQLSQIFSIASYQYNKSSSLFKVTFQGERAIYVGKYETEKRPYRYTVEIVPAEPTETNPYGLAVASLEQGEATEGPQKSLQRQGEGIVKAPSRTVG